MAKSLTADQLRALSKKGEANAQMEHEERERVKKELQRKKDLENARSTIARAEKAMKNLAGARGIRSYEVCTLGSDKYDPQFEQKCSPEFLGVFGKTVYNHFESRGFKISFKPEIEDEWYYYTLIVHW